MAQEETMSSSGQSEYVYRWITDPPIIGLDSSASGREADLVRYADELRADVAAWSSDLAPPLPGNAGKGVPQPGVIAKALDMCDTFRGASLSSKEILFVYPLAGRPVAMMIFNPQLGTDDKGNDCGYVCDIVVHPGVDFGGAIMLEFALNYLKKHAIAQALELWALDDSAELLGAYSGFGFEQIPGKPSKQALRLIPLSKPAKWELADAGWRYKSSRPMGPLYATASKRP
jgi:hypothetical protein